MKAGLCFDTGSHELMCYIDDDWAQDIDTMRSTSGYLVTFVRGVVFWQSKLQKCVALSTIKVEYIIVTKAGKEMLWMKQFLKGEGTRLNSAGVCCSMRQSECHTSQQKFKFHSKSKHIDILYHWI